MSPSKIVQAFQSATTSWFPSESQLGDLQKQWLDLSPDQVNAAWEATRKHWAVRHSEELRWIGFVLGVLGYVYLRGRQLEMGPAFALDFVQFVVSMFFSGVLGLILVALVLRIIGVLDLIEPERLLAPASSQPGMCVKALQIVEKSDRARAYRNTVVSLGRDLRVMDLEHLENEARRERWDQPRRENERICKELHGLNFRAPESPASRNT